jgi:hypothetical protein
MAFLVVVRQRLKLWKGLEKNPAKSIGALSNQSGTQLASTMTRMFFSTNFGK